jgi:hypothetical protein
MIEKIKCWSKGKTIYDIHSPFLFDLLNSFLDNSQQFYVFNTIRNNCYSKNTKIKLFKIIRYWKPSKLYLLHPICAGSLQFLRATNSHLSVVEVNGPFRNFISQSCLIMDYKNHRPHFLEAINQISLSSSNQDQMILIVNPPKPFQLSLHKIDSKYNLVISTKNLLLLMSKPGYQGNRYHLMVSRFTKPWRLGFFN